MTDMERAIHEGGHSAVALALALEVSSVTIEPSTVVHANGSWERYAGRTDVVLGVDQVRNAIIYLAGPQASQRWNPGTERSSDMDEDRHAAGRHIDAAVGDILEPGLFAIHRTSLARRARELTAELVQHYWPEIEALANALVGSRTLTGDEVTTIFDSSLRNRYGRKFAFSTNSRARSSEKRCAV